MTLIAIYKNNKNQSQEQMLFSKVRHANRFVSRLRGLLGYPPLKSDEGLLLTPCAQIHTLGMRTPLDIVFLSKSGVVIKCVTELPPQRCCIAARAHHTLELSPGAIARERLKEGDQLTWRSIQEVL